MLRKLWVLLGPLLVILLVYSLTLAAIVIGSSAIGYLFAGGGYVDLGGLWRAQVPIVVAAGSIFGVLAVVRWIEHLWVFRRKLRQSGTSLQEFASWPRAARNAWIKSDQQLEN